MADGREAETLMLVRPRQRGVLPLDGFHVPTRLARTVRAASLTVEVDGDFEAVMAGCAAPTAARHDSWINREIRDAYMRLHQLGHAHSVECREKGMLVGGLYGVRIGGVFFGESMFSLRADASKIALVHLAGRMNRAGFSLLDTQFTNSHLEQFHVREIPHALYQRQLDQAVAQTPDMTAFHAAMSGDEAVAYARQSTSQAS